MIKEKPTTLVSKTQLEVTDSISRAVYQYIEKYKSKEDTRMIYFGLSCRMRDTFILDALDADEWGINFYEFNTAEDEKLYYRLVSDLADFYYAVEQYYTFKAAALSTGEDSYMNPERRVRKDEAMEKAKSLYPKLIENWDEKIVMPIFLPWVVM